MVRKSLHALFAISVFTAGCSADYSGSYKGDAVESGTLKVAVMTAPEVAKNESPPRKVPGVAVTVTKESGGYGVKFGDCALKGGEPSAAGLVVATGECDVKIANWAGSLPLSATLTFGDGGALSMEVTSTTKEVKRNDVTVMSYEWTFKGKK